MIHPNMIIDIQNQPLVSIGLPVYNGETYIKEALDSLLLQDYQNIELIVSDNASTDNTYSICNEYAKRDLRVRFFSQKSNIGAYENFKFVLNNSNGLYFMWAACDDIWTPQFVSSLVEILEKNPDTNLAMCAIKRIYENGIEKDILKFPYLNQGEYYNFFNIAKNVINGEKLNIFVYGVFRKSFLIKNIQKNYPQVIAGDRIFILLTSLHSRLMYVDKIMYIKRIMNEPVEVRFKNDELGKLYSKKFRNIRYFMNVSYNLLTSDMIPPSRKKIAVKLIILQFFQLVKPPFISLLSSLYPKIKY